jgi:CubicO group peptidase (beta-lactamase class C family)
MKKIILLIAIIISIGVILFWFNIDKHVRYLIVNQPTSENPLFWTTEQRDAAFQSIEKLGILPYQKIAKSDTTVPKKESTNRLTLDETLIDRFFDEQRIGGLVVMHKGNIVFERYGLEFHSDKKWTSFSVAKSFTSTLVGAAIKDGFIRSLDDKVSDYIAGMRGSEYDNVTIEQLLTMTSGVQWNEDYTDPESDVNQFNFHTPTEGVDVTVSYLRDLPRAHPPGEQYLYSTGETNLIGVLISEATGLPLSEYLSEKVWQHIGAEQDASWLLGPTGHEISGCCIQASTRDFARFGQFIAKGANVDGESILPEGYLAKATAQHVQFDAGDGYGFQWWVFADGIFHGRGIFGQGIFIDIKNELVIAVNSNWPVASSSEYRDKKYEMYRYIQAQIK